MFALGFHYLNGWSMAAADGPQKEQAEWPPHPDRVFMALAAAWFETGEDIAEGNALRWLEGLPPPAIAASEASLREPVVSYVPVNDDGHKKISSPKTALAKLQKKGLAYLPEYRLRRPRGFPVAVPQNPTVRLVWQGHLHEHRDKLASLASKITHIGHSASFVQAWIEDGSSIPTTWEPTAGVPELRMRVPFNGRLDSLTEAGDRRSWIAYRDLDGEIDRAKSELRAMKQPPRTAWRDFPDAVLLASERETLSHPEYPSAKSGDSEAAAKLADALVNETGLDKIRWLLDREEENRPVLVSAHAYERNGYNAIPSALARLINERLGIPYDTNIVQTNIVGHTKADGYGRLARQAVFAGEVKPGSTYILIDDFIGQGGTLANLRGWVDKNGGTVIIAVVLTGKPYSAKLNPTQEQLHDLREKHGPDFEKWWHEHFGHTFDNLTQSEARYLARSPDVDTIRNRIAAAMRERDGRGHWRSPRTQKRKIADLKARLKERFPDGKPRNPMRPAPGKWQSYARPKEPSTDLTPASIFDPNIIVLVIEGTRIASSATLKLTAALRGLLMRECEVQPPPEWFSGHDASGRPTTAPHIALSALPFVGADHADGKVMGMALILPQTLAASDVGALLGPILLDARTGLPREHFLFDGAWFECRLALDTRERPPVTLRPLTWTSPSRTWATVSPVVLNRHFDGADRWARAAESVKDACGHIGLPRPKEVSLHPVSAVGGVPHVREFPRVMRKGNGGRQSHSHAVLVFEEPVAGPVLVGAGRFRGYGLCRPMDYKWRDG